MPRVWVVNESGHNFEAAEEYGELVPLTQGKVNIFNTERLYAEFQEKMRNLQPEDWILLSGNMVLNILATMVALKRQGEVRILIYDVINKEYVPREVKF